MQNPNKYLEQLTKPQHLLIGGVVALGAAAFKLDQSIGGREVLNRSSEVPDPIVRSKEEATKTLIVMLGLGMHPEETADTLESILSDDCNLVVPVYPEVGFPVDKIFDRLYQTLTKLDSEYIYLDGPSNGGNLECDFIEYGYRTGQGEIADRVHGIALDGTPGKKEDIKLIPRAVLKAAGWFEKSWFVEHNKARFMKHHQGLGKIPLTATVAQGKYLYGEHYSLSRSPEKVLWLRGPQDDLVVKEDSAIETIQSRVNTPIEVKVDDLRKPTHTDTSIRGFGLVLREFGLLRSEQPQFELQPAA